MPALNALLGLGSPVRTRTMQTTGKTQSTGHQAHLTPTPGRSSRLELFQTGINRLIQALHIIKGYSSACPQLETAVGALLIALEAYNKYSDVMEALDVLLTRMEPLQDLIRKALEAGYDKCPKALRDRLEAFASKVQSVADDANALRSRRLIVRFINASDYTVKVEGWVKKLSWHIQSFILEGTIALELTVHEGFTQMEGRFDRLDHGIKVANEGINGLRDDLDHKLTDDPLRTRLRPVIQARFDHGSSVHVECHEGTRGEVLATLCSWLRPDDPRLSSLPPPIAAVDSTRPLLWVYALPGVGKSTIALTVAGFWYEDKVLGATFFCAKDGERSNVVAIFRTLAYQLAQRFPEYREALTTVLDENPDVPFASPSRQLEKLIAEPIQVAEKKGAFKGRVPIVIDALDECKDEAAVSTVLLSLALHIAKLGPLWILITSRLQENITRGFRQQALLANTQQLNLTDIPQDLTKRDIATFVRSRFEDIKRDYSHLPLPSDWPPPLQLTQLLTLADVLFIYASTAMRFVGDEKERSPVKYNGWYSALRLHDAAGRVVWIEHHPTLIRSVAFSEDCTRALVGNNIGEVFLYDLTQLISADKSAPRVPQPLAVPEHQFSTGSSFEVWHVSFSLDDQAIITPRNYIPLSPELQPLSKRAADASRPPAYLLDDDGWLWRVDPKLNHRRIRWVPPSFRPGPYEFARTWSSRHGHGIACRTSDGRLVVLDVSQY